MTDLKTVLVDALNLAGRFPGSTEVDDVVELGVNDTIHTNYSPLQMNATVLATAVRDHFLDREKVRAALSDILSGVEIDTDHGSIGQLGGRRASYRYPPGIMRPTIRIEDDLVDRFLAGLSGGSE